MKGLIELNTLIDSMKSDKLSNYVVAGLDSYLLDNGRVRYFECSRDHQDQITPHSHRFDFMCFVLSGSVKNLVWSKTSKENGDLFQASQLEYTGEVGVHNRTLLDQDYYSYRVDVYKTGDWYGLSAEDIHSIQFSRGAKVLFFEGCNKSDKSIIIEPVVNGEVIGTYKKLPYMFKRTLLDE